MANSGSTPENLADIAKNPYTGRYPELRSRSAIWEEVVRYLVKDLGIVQTLVELGPGYCDFINQYPATRKMAYEINPEMEKFAADDVRIFIKNANSISMLEGESVDMVFASNFLEHLDKSELNKLLPAIWHVLKRGGLLVLIQPNYRLCKKNYFEDPTHKTIFSDLMLSAFLSEYGFLIRKIVPGFLPFSMKSKLPKCQFLVRLYLLSPFKPMAAQMYCVAVKE